MLSSLSNIPSWSVGPIRLFYCRTCSVRAVLCVCASRLQAIERSSSSLSRLFDQSNSCPSFFLFFFFLPAILINSHLGALRVTAGWGFCVKQISFLSKLQCSISLAYWNAFSRVCLRTAVETFPDASLALEWQLFLTVINRGWGVERMSWSITNWFLKCCVKICKDYIEVCVFQSKGLLSPQYFSYYDNYMLQERIKWYKMPTGSSWQLFGDSEHRAICSRAANKLDLGHVGKGPNSLNIWIGLPLASTNTFSCNCRLWQILPSVCKSSANGELGSCSAYNWKNATSFSFFVSIAKVAFVAVVMSGTEFQALPHNMNMSEAFTNEL